MTNKNVLTLLACGRRIRAAGTSSTGTSSIRGLCGARANGQGYNGEMRTHGPPLTRGVLIAPTLVSLVSLVAAPLAASMRHNSGSDNPWRDEIIRPAPDLQRRYSEASSPRQRRSQRHPRAPLAAADSATDRRLRDYATAQIERTLRARGASLGLPSNLLAAHAAGGWRPRLRAWLSLAGHPVAIQSKSRILT